jgi:hypothetical protein
MRLTCTRIFGATFLATAICFVWLGDFNTYVPGQGGQRMILDDGDVLGVMVSTVFAAAIALWVTLAFWISWLFWTALRKRAA